MNRLFSYGLIGVVFLFNILPLVVGDGLFFPFITGKAFLFRFLVEIGVVLLLLLAIEDRRYMPRLTPITIFFGLFVGVMLVADLLGAYSVKSIWSNFERMEGWITLIHLLGAFVLFERVLSIFDLWRKWLAVSLGVSVLVGMHGVLQLLGVAEIHQGGVRLDANFGNATYMAVYALFHVFFAGFMAATSSTWWVRGVYGAIGLINILLVYFSGTRGAFLGLLVGGAVALLVYALSTKNKRVLGAFLGLVVASGLFFGALQVFKEHPVIAKDPILVRIADISLEAGETRFRIWGIALQGVMERPVLGWGQENFSFVFSKYYNPALYDQEPWFDRAHNVYLDWLVAGGVFGLTAYLLLFGSIVVALWRGRFAPLEKAALLGVLAAYAVNNLFVFDNLISYLLFAFVAAYVASRVEKEFAWPKLDFHPHIMRSLIIIIGLFVIYMVQVPALSANKTLLQAISPQYSLEERRALFDEALSYTTFADQEIAEQMRQLAFSALQQENIPNQMKGQLLLDAAQALHDEARRMPESARMHLLYGTTVRVLGNLEEAHRILGEAYQIAPNKQSVVLEYALTKELLGNKEEALELYERAYLLAPGYAQAKEVYEAAQERLAK